ncbi:MAG: transcription elongation factor GreA [Firmicutes bacterium]|nr:transcription elongation factor GreA [Alicyclobacillaceae bacterium]MCL6497150.1 transcription elongation factor GreA [Bacillota bacterium]
MPGGKKGSGLNERELLVSAEGLKKLEAELEYLKTVKRMEVAERIKTAREFGDISENSEYEDAKNEQAFVEGRIQTLEKMLRQARVVDSDKEDPTTVHIGSRVTVRDLDEDIEEQYDIVGAAEADPSKNRISNESPVGKALMGVRVGDVVEVNAPAGKIRYQVIAIR